ncbi:MAG: hypothetical protein OXB95_11430 [Rhodobacteraceae bacterium]|nr:hypothetical protein [Paracoccaceae bacterium]
MDGRDSAPAFIAEPGGGSEGCGTSGGGEWHLSAVGEAELRYGVAPMPPGHRRDALVRGRA